MNNILLFSILVATGAAWGMIWLAGFGLFKKDMCNASLLKLITLVFVSVGSVYAIYYCYSIYSEYSKSSSEGTNYFETHFSGNNLIINGGSLLIYLTPVILIIPILRKSKIICATVGVCYVLLPYYAYIISRVGS